MSSAHAGECNRQPGVFLQELAKISKACHHELCGRIYRPATAETAVKPSCSNDAWSMFDADAKAALASNGVLLLGEIHDSPAQHLLQATAVKEFAQKGSNAKTAIVFEQIREDQQDGLDRFATFAKSKGRVPKAADLKQFIDWAKSGWPKDIYDPLFQAVIDAGLPIYAGDVSRAAIMKAAREGQQGVPAEERKRLGLSIPLGAKIDAASLAELEDAHCGAMPKSALTGMAYAQRYRDAHLADVVLKAADKNRGAILIAGDGHARTDRGVPWYLRKRAPGKKVVAVMFVEVERGKTDAKSYVPRDPEGKAAVDYIVFTPRAERGDPCEKLRKK